MTKVGKIESFLAEWEVVIAQNRGDRVTFVEVSDDQYGELVAKSRKEGVLVVRLKGKDDEVVVDKRSFTEYSCKARVGTTRVALIQFP